MSGLGDLAAIGRIVGGGVDGLRSRKYDDRMEQDQAFQQERQGRERKAWDRQDENLAKSDRANAAFATYLNNQREVWAKQTGQPPEAYRPDLNAQVGALDARGTQLAADGNWEELIKQRSQAAPFYTAARNNAIDKGLAQYDADGDPIKLAQAVYPHIRDGRKITMAKTVTGKDGKPTVQFSMDDGSTDAVEPEQLVATLKRLRMDPELAAKMDVEHLKARIKAEEGKRQHGNNLELEGVRQAGARGLADVNNEASLGRTKISADATRYSADKGAESREKVAKTTADAKGKGDKATTEKQLSDMVIQNYGTPAPAGNANIGNATTAQVLQGAQLYLKENPDAGAGEAMNAAAAALGLGKKRKGL